MPVARTSASKWWYLLQVGVRYWVPVILVVALTVCNCGNEWNCERISRAAGISYSLVTRLMAFMFSQLVPKQISLAEHLKGQVSTYHCVIIR